MSADYKHSILWRGEDPTKQKFTPLVQPSKKIARYRAGAAPKWAQEEEQSKDAAASSSDKRDLRRDRRRRGGAEILESRPEDTAASRLKRLAQSEGLASGAERLLRHRVVHDAQVLEATDEQKDEMEKKEDDDDFRRLLKRAKAETPGLAELRYDEMSGDEAEGTEIQALRRERMREVALLKRKEEEDILKEEEDEAQQDEVEEESEYESESEDDDPRRHIMMKPVFVSKHQRETVKEKEIMQKEEEESAAKAKEQAKERKAETKSMVIDVIKATEEAENERDAAEISEPELIDDDDEKNEAEEYELWKIRELKRIKRDKEERLTRQKEIEFILRRRNMTDEERAADDLRLDSESKSYEEAKSFNFLQKYYHRGGFFQDKATAGEEPLYLRDYHEPTEEEKFDKNLLPKAMQLRRGQFGKKGQVKHTHLTEVDTTDMQAAWAQNTKQIQKYQEKMAAAKGVNTFDRPALSKKV